MKFLKDLIIIAPAVTIAATTNSVAALWAREPYKITPYLFLLLLLSPLVFISFGIVTGMKGLSVSSGIIDSLLIITTMSIGLIFFGEWNKVSSMQLLGMGLAFCGILLMLYFPKAEA